jgi:molybdate transport system substrate-binding protein
MRGEGKFWKVPAEAYPALDQGVVVVSHSPHKREAAAFVDYIKTKDAADVLRRYGFTVP